MASVEKQRKRTQGWKPGQSGNPKGRPPRHECLTSLLKAELETINPEDKKHRTWKQLVVLAMLRLAIKGNSAAIKEVWERSDGKVLDKSRHEITGADGEPFVAEIRLVKARHDDPQD